MKPYTIVTERLGLREWKEADLQPFAEMNMDPDVMRYYPAVLSVKETGEMIGRIRAHFEKNHFGLWAVENKLTNEFIGYTGFYIPAFESFFTPCVEIGWKFKKHQWGYGFATEAAHACLRYGFETLHFNKIVSFTSVLNKKSENVMKRIGMSYVTRFEHPLVERNHILRPHVLYQIERS
jgi:[ribosomal protein S5]-alanine N-acetyltransferase